MDLKKAVSPSFLGHVVLQRGALEAAVTRRQKFSDIRSRIWGSYKYHCSCSKRIFVPDHSTGEKMLLPEFSPESGFFGLFKNSDFTQLGSTDNLESKGEHINKNQLNTLLGCRTEFSFDESKHWEFKQDRGDRKSV